MLRHDPRSTEGKILPELPPKARKRQAVLKYKEKWIESKVLELGGDTKENKELALKAYADFGGDTMTKTIVYKMIKDGDRNKKNKNKNKNTRGNNE